MSKILHGWYNVLTKKTTELDRKKAGVCETCVNARYSKYIDFVQDELVQVKGFVCDACGCPLISKIRSGDKCPLNKW